jgi:hypothetical protein
MMWERSHTSSPLPLAGTSPASGPSGTRFGTLAATRTDRHMVSSADLTFPEGFTWGVSTSSYRPRPLWPSR